VACGGGGFLALRVRGLRCFLSHYRVARVLDEGVEEEDDGQARIPLPVSREGQRAMVASR
jgi:hypothetical protein